MLVLVMKLESLAAVRVKDDRPAKWLLPQQLLDTESVYVSLHRFWRHSCLTLGCPFE